MSYALQLLLGGALFLAVLAALGWMGVVSLAIALFALELIHDLRGYRKPTS